VKAAQNQIVLLDVLEMKQPKTKEMATIIEKLVGAESALILLPDADEMVEKSVRNLPDSKTLRATYLNVRDLLGYDHVIIPLGALEVIQSYLGV
jgi:large subunit ribosomal protein L4